jgi:hypothetical protein
MTLEERDRLDRLLAQLAAVRGIPKDPAAEERMATALARQPDAAYLLVTRVLLLEQALEEANARAAAAEWQRVPGQIQRQAQESEPTRQPPAPAENARLAAAPAADAWGRRAAPAAAPASGGRSFLRDAAAAAAGVAGGAFLFQGLQHLLGHGSGWGAGNAGADAGSHVADARVEDLAGPRLDTADADADPLADDGTDLADADLDGDLGGDFEA